MNAAWLFTRSLSSVGLKPLPPFWMLLRVASLDDFKRCPGKSLLTSPRLGQNPTNVSSETSVSSWQVSATAGLKPYHPFLLRNITFCFGSRTVGPKPHQLFLRNFCFFLASLCHGWAQLPPTFFLSL